VAVLTPSAILVVNAGSSSLKLRVLTLLAGAGADSVTGSADLPAPGGAAEAAAIKAKSDSLEGEGADKQLMQTVMLRLAEAFETARVPLVPQIQVGGSSGDGGNAFGTLLSLMNSLKAAELARLVTPGNSGTRPVA